MHSNDWMYKCTNSKEELTKLNEHRHSTFTLYSLWLCSETFFFFFWFLECIRRFVWFLNYLIKKMRLKCSQTWGCSDLLHSWATNEFLRSRPVTVISILVWNMCQQYWTKSIWELVFIFSLFLDQSFVRCCQIEYKLNATWTSVANAKSDARTLYNSLNHNDISTENQSKANY